MLTALLIGWENGAILFKPIVKRSDDDGEDLNWKSII